MCTAALQLFAQSLFQGPHPSSRYLRILIHPNLALLYTKPARVIGTTQTILYKAQNHCCSDHTWCLKLVYENCPIYGQVILKRFPLFTWQGSSQLLFVFMACDGTGKACHRPQIDSQARRP